MNTFAAVFGLRRFERRLTGIRGNRDVEAKVVVDYFIVPDRDKRRIGYKDSLEVGVLYCEPGHYNLAQVMIRSINTIEVDTVGQAQGVDNGSPIAGAHQRERRQAGTASTSVII